MGDLVEREAYLKRGTFLQLIIILSSAFLRHGFLHSVKAYRRSRLLSCGKSKKMLLPVVINLNTLGLFFFFFFFSCKGGVELVVCTVSKRLEWSASILFCSFFFLFFFYYSRTFCKQPPKCRNTVVAYGWSFVKTSLCVKCEQKKKNSEAWGRE